MPRNVFEYSRIESAVRYTCMTAKFWFLLRYLDPIVHIDIREKQEDTRGAESWVRVEQLLLHFKFG